MSASNPTPIRTDCPERDFFKQAGALCGRFPGATCLPPPRVSQDLTERQRHILTLLGDGRKWPFQEACGRIDNPPSDRTVRHDLILLREFGLVAGQARGADARCWLVSDPRRPATIVENREGIKQEKGKE